MTESLITYRGIVYPWQCDHMGHMNVMWYVGKFDEATWHLCAQLGLTPSFLRQNNRGMAAVEQTISYKRELMPGDLITISSAVLEVKDKSIRFSHEMRKENSGEIAATTILVGVHLDTATRRACAFPPDVSERARKMIAG
jgi:acyl-CoA thioester hydrolase